MPFIPKNPLIVPEVESPPSAPFAGTRGIFAGKDGWSDIDSNGKTNRFVTSKDIEEALEEIASLKEIIDLLYAKSLVKKITITLPHTAWDEIGDNQYSQKVVIEDITEFSQIDLQPTPEQLTIFYEKDITFVVENDNKTVTVYCIGQEPTDDYTMQATVTEVERNE